MSSSPVSEELRSSLLLSSNKTCNYYSRGYIPKFETYVNDMCHGNTPYVFDGIRIMIKLYLLFPNLSQKQSKMTTYCLMLAFLHNNDNNDFQTLLYMIPKQPSKKASNTKEEQPDTTTTTTTPEEDVGDDKSTAANIDDLIIECNGQLSNCHFDKFWSVFMKLENCDDDDDVVIKQLCRRHKTSNVEKRILQMIALSYEKASITMIRKALNRSTTSEDDSLTGLKQYDFVQEINDDVVVFTATSDNTKRQRIYQEGVTFNNVSQLIGKMSKSSLITAQ